MYTTEVIGVWPKSSAVTLAFIIVLDLDILRGASIHVTALADRLSLLANIPAVDDASACHLYCLLCASCAAHGYCYKVMPISLGPMPISSRDNLILCQVVFETWFCIRTGGNGPLHLSSSNENMMHGVCNVLAG